MIKLFKNRKIELFFINLNLCVCLSQCDSSTSVQFNL